MTALPEIGGYIHPLKLLMVRPPLACVGLGWLLPSLLAAAGVFVPRKHRSRRKSEKNNILPSPPTGALLCDVDRDILNPQIHLKGRLFPL